MAITIAGGTHLGSGTAVVSSLIDPATGNVQPIGQTGYTLTMSEEFGGTMTVTDPTLGYVTFRSGGPTWATWYPNWPMFTSQTPGANHTNTNQGAYYDTSKVTLDGAGALKLACDKQVTATGLPYTAGMIQSLPSLTPLYGYMEAKIKVATAAADGHWPAWWSSTATYNSWPPEIDFWEYFGNGTTYQNNVYLKSTEFQANATATQNAYHVYGCKWTPSATTFYVDGTQTNTTTQTPNEALYLLLNNGVYAAHNPVFASNDMLVDYVRVWQ